MKKIILLYIIIVNNWMIVYSQNNEHDYSLNTTQIDKLFFSDSNDKIRFVFEQSYLFANGLKIYRDSESNKFMVEIKYVNNWPQINDSLNKLFPKKDNVKTITEAQWQELKKQRQAEQVAMREKLMQCLVIKVQVIQISDSLAEDLYSKTMDVVINSKPIKNKNEDGAVLVVRGGYSVLLQCKDSVKTMTTQSSMPEGDLKYLSNIFRQMITDVIAGNFAESKFIELLNKIESKM